MSFAPSHSSDQTERDSIPLWSAPFSSWSSAWSTEKQSEPFMNVWRTGHRECGRKVVSNDVNKKREIDLRESVYTYTHTHAYIFKEYTAHLAKLKKKKLLLQYVSWEITIVGNVSICLARPFLCPQERFLCQEANRCEERWLDKVWLDGHDLTS